MEEDIEKIKEVILKEKRIAAGISSIVNSSANASPEEKRLIDSQMAQMKSSLRNVNDELLKAVDKVNVGKPLPKMETKASMKEDEETEKEKKKPSGIIDELSRLFGKKNSKMPELDMEILKRLKKGKKKEVEKKEKKPSEYVKFANNLFAAKVRTMLKDKKLASLEKDLVKSNLGYTPVSYISLIITSTIIAAGIAFFLMIFFLFFNVSPEFPIITLSKESIITRFVKVIWLLFAAPALTFLMMYTYPSIEKKTIGAKINQELPFATIHMAAIAGSLIEPTRVFRIVASTKEYPHLEREINKLLNSINVYGYDLVTALKVSSTNCPSQKLAELFDGLATTITSGGDLFDFFEKRSQTLLFEYRLDRQKSAKSAETFMDIYISVVIAAPMILMLMLIMIKISGLGLSLSTGMITLLVVGGVSVINVLFLIFLQAKQSTSGAA